MSKTKEGLNFYRDKDGKTKKISFNNPALLGVQAWKEIIKYQIFNETELREIRIKQGKTVLVLNPYELKKIKKSSVAVKKKFLDETTTTISQSDQVIIADVTPKISFINLSALEIKRILDAQIRNPEGEISCIKIDSDKTILSTETFIPYRDQKSEMKSSLENHRLRMELADKVIVQYRSPQIQIFPARKT